ncbi:MAG: hypothetical protein ACRC7O_08205, partial [Fimbriiglobus sp.]
PLLSPFAVVFGTSKLAGGSLEWLLFTGLGYGGLQLAVAAFTLSVAMRAVRKSRATLAAAPRHRDADRVQNRPAKHFDPDAPLAVARPVRRIVPIAELIEEEPQLRRRTDRVPAEIANRLPVDDDDPFGWKERHISGVKRDDDDDSIRGLTIAVGASVAMVVGGFAAIAGLMLLVGSGSRATAGMASGLLLVGGGAGLFLYLLAVGSTACGTVCRERQRLTLESLLTIPVDRTAILGPKLWASAATGWWWGVPASASVVLGLLASDVPGVVVPGAFYLAASVPAAASYGLWLSVRCRTITRAVLWFLPIAGVMAGFPTVLGMLAEPENRLGTVSAMTAGAVALVVGGFAFWRATCAAFEREGRT